MNRFASKIAKRFARTLMLAIDADCITYRHYIPWADRMIQRLAQPPLWICDLSVKKYKPDALDTVGEYVWSEPFEQFTDEDSEYIGFLFIRYQRHELSWATFLNEAGRRTDALNGNIDCEYFYLMLNELEEKEFGPEIEQRQVSAVKIRLGSSIENTKRFYDDFLRVD